MRRPERRGWARTLAEFVLRQVPVLLVADAIYVAVRAVTEGTPAVAERNARTLLDVERTLGLDWERAVQAEVLQHRWLVELANATYVWMYWPFVFAALAVVFVIDRDRYLLLRNAIFVAGAIGMVIFATVPVAPPRFMPGYVGTVSEAARQHFATRGPHFVNRYAALPSFHAGWTLLVSLVLASVCHRRALRVLALLPGVAMIFAVVATGNHYIVDVVLGGAISVGAFAALLRRREGIAVDRGPA
jgi:hypothetical protein